MSFETIVFLFYRLLLLWDVVNVQADACMKREIFTLVAKGNNTYNCSMRYHFNKGNAVVYGTTCKYNLAKAFS